MAVYKFIYRRNDFRGCAESHNLKNGNRRQSITLRRRFFAILYLINIFAYQLFVNAGIDISIFFLFMEIPDCLLGTPMIATEARDANIAECDFPILHRNILRRA